MTKKTTPAYRASKEETIPINKLHPFSNHPFHIRHDLEFSELVDSISESGIITPIIVRPKVGVGYEVISGHRRWEACKELGIESIPARVEYIDDDEATILMVNSNIQREHVLPSEKAFAYKMRMEAMKHQGKATSSQLGTKLRTLDSKSRIHAADYSSVYIANLPADYDLDRCFQEFNAPNRPLRYHMCSLSTSDIVVTTKNGKETAYYVDSIGFKDVSHLLPELHEVEAQRQKEQVQDEPER